MRRSAFPRREVTAFAVATALAVGGLAAARAPTTHPALRICADPNDLPFSSRAGQGFENEIAALFARDLGVTTTYDWLAQSRGFVRKTLDTGACDVVMGVPTHYGPVLTTRAYYRSTYVFLYRADRGWRITSFDDPRLQHLRIGIPLVGDDDGNTPPAEALAARGIIDNVKGYVVDENYGRSDPHRRLVDAVAAGEVDVAVVWGPIAGYFAVHEPVALAYTPVAPSLDASGQRFAFEIAIGVRRGNRALAETLDSLIVREQPTIARILARYHVPQASAPFPATSSNR